MALLLINKQMIEFSDSFGNGFRTPVTCSNCGTDFINENWHYWKFCPECGESIENARVARDTEKEVIDEMLKIMEIAIIRESQNEFN